MSSTSTIHIVGAGVAGLAAGVAASAKGHRVVLYETAPQAGGRCRAFHDKRLKTVIDNGNHLVMGANRSVLAYLEHIGSLGTCITHDRPRYPFIDLASRRHRSFAPPRFPGIPWREWLHLLRLFRPARGKTVAQCIPQDSALYKTLIEPFTLAALNTAPQEASAPLLSQVLRQLITGGREAWRYYVPAHGLSATFVDPALARIKGRGGSIRTRAAVQGLSIQNDRVTALRVAGDAIPVAPQDAVILAVPPHALDGLLPEAAPDFTYSPILNAHFLWPQSGMFREAMPFLGVIGGTAQWIFFHEGCISTTTSAAGHWVDMDEDALADLLWQDVRRALFLDAARVPPCRIIKEKRATYAATPQNLAKRPQAATAQRNLFLAGDYIASPHPATLEAAVSSGFTAAALAMETVGAANND